MTEKLITYDSELRGKLLNSVKKTASITKKTMGPKGLNVLLDDNRGARVTKDGITVIRSLQFNDPIENTALKFIREASEKTNTIGDGTTGTCVLTESIFSEGLKNLNFGVNGIHLRNGIQKAANIAIDFVKKYSKPIKTHDEIRQVAKISSNHSDEIADVLADMFDKIGENGTIRVEPGNSRTIESKVVEGMVFDSGYLSPYFVTNESMTSDFEDAWVLILGKKLSDIKEIITTLQSVTESGKPLLIIADGVEGDALATLVLNSLKGNLKSCAVNAPSYGTNKDNMLDDIAIITGGQVVSERTGIAPSEAIVGSGILGRAKRVIVSKDSTTILGGYGNQDVVNERIEQLKNLLAAGGTDAWDTKKMQERLAKLDGGVGIISVGANTQAEMLEKRDLVDDAFSACKAAISGGVVPGGGVALLRAANELQEYIDSHSNEFTDDEIIGAKILHDSLNAPIKTILENAGESVDLIVAKINEEDDKQIGYDALNKKYGNMIDLGVVDPTNVVVAEIENASSVASLLLTTAAACVLLPEENKNLQIQ